MQSINQIWPRVAGKRNLENVIFILLLTLPYKFWLLATDGELFHVARDLKLTVRKPAVFLQFLFKNEHGILKIN